MNTYLRILPIAFLGTLLLGGCLGPPRIETSVYEGPKGSVVLRTVSEASYRPSHPADVSVETFEKVLTGIHYRRSPGRWLQRLLDRGAKSSPVLSPTQVAFWPPHLRHAFLQVTAEERVFIRIPLQSTSAFQHLTGVLSFKENDLHMALTLSDPAGQGPRSKTKPRTSDALGVTKPTVTFLPKRAVKTSRDQGPGTTFTIDLASLATSQGPVSKDSPSKPDTASGHVAPRVIPLKPTHRLRPSPPTVSPNSPKTPSKPDVAPRRIAPKVIPPAAPPQQLESPPRSDSLMEEIRALRRELSRQQQEIERLKKQRESP